MTDVTYKVVITRLGDKLRGAGTAELAGYDLSLRPSRLATISHVMADLFPGAGELAQAQNWCGLRPMTPDNPPVTGLHVLQKSVPQHRPRYPRLDHGLWLGKNSGGYYLGSQRGH